MQSSFLKNKMQFLKKLKGKIQNYLMSNFITHNAKISKNPKAFLKIHSMQNQISLNEIFMNHNEKSQKTQ